MRRAQIKVNGLIYGGFEECSYFHIDFSVAACCFEGVFI